MAKKILLAEDDAPIASALELKLQNEGYEVTLANDGAKALKMVEKNNYDLILLDLIMPEVDGFDVLKKLKDENNEVSVVVLSNLGQDEDIKRAKELGAKGYFVKSNVDLSDLVEKIKTYF